MPWSLARTGCLSWVAFSTSGNEHLRSGIEVAGTVSVESEQPDPLADDAAHRVNGAHVPCHGPRPQTRLKHVEAVSLHGPQNVDVLRLALRQRLRHRAMGRPSAGESDLPRDLVI